MRGLSDDEGMILVTSAIACAVAAARGATAIVRLPRRRGLSARATLVVAPVACAVLLLTILRHAAAREVRVSVDALTLFECIGLASVAGVVALARFVGIGARHDAIERGNPAAAVAIAGAMLGQTLAYAGANVGEGATIWTTIGPAAMATLALLLAWLALEAAGHASEGITVDRDVAGGARLAGALTAIGALLGRAAAGDYVSAGATLRDFARLGWPALALANAAGCADRALRPTPRTPRPNVIACGIVPAIVYLAFAAAVSWR